MVKQLGFIFDFNRCVGCKACEMACHNENHTPPRVRWRRVTPLSPDTFLSLSCNHCENPECFRVCPNRAYTKRRDGIVIINSDSCDGCQKCIQACPYKAPQYNPEIRKVSKCNLCLPRQEKGMIPACVQACHTGALRLIELNEGGHEEAVLSVEGFPDIRTTHPSIRFIRFRPGKRYMLKD
ncbi:4Fe-4S dicluster domain-containing protein [Desulfitobacterium sp. AusDCA]|uniref:4Fe-4S dicluster domain-containing protein n=1 Tax=Desulfitobacterium sp. AusDCA TaxID=3240383 RepID=UPI003DA70DCD